MTKKTINIVLIGIIALFLFVGMLFGLTLKKVGVHEVGVRTTQFALGGETGVTDTDFGPGYQWDLGPLHKWVTYDSTVQTLNLNGANAVTVRTVDGFQIKVDLTVKYRIQEKKAHNLYKEYGSNAKKYKNQVHREAENTFRDAFGDLRAEDFYKSKIYHYMEDGKGNRLYLTGIEPPEGMSLEQYATRRVARVQGVVEKINIRTEQVPEMVKAIRVTNFQPLPDEKVFDDRGDVKIETTDIPKNMKVGDKTPVLVDLVDLETMAIRQQMAEEAQVILSKRLQKSHVNVIAFLIRDVVFPDVYEQEIRKKKLADQGVELQRSQQRAIEEQKRVEKVEKEIAAEVGKIRRDLERQMAELGAENDKAITVIMADANKQKVKILADADKQQDIILAEARKKVQIKLAEANRTREVMLAEADKDSRIAIAEAEKTKEQKVAKARRHAAEQTAIGTELKLKAEAEGTKLMNAAMAGPGGMTYVALQAVRNLRLADFEVSSLETDVLSVEEMAEKLGLPRR